MEQGRFNDNTYCDSHIGLDKEWVPVNSGWSGACLHCGVSRFNHNPYDAYTENCPTPKTIRNYGMRVVKNISVIDVQHAYMKFFKENYVSVL